MSTALLDCGHAPTPTENGLGTGTAYTPDPTAGDQDGNGRIDAPECNWR